MKDGTHMTVRIYSQRDSCSGFRVSEDTNKGEEELGVVKGGVEDRGPLERFTWTLVGVCERS